MKKRLIKRRVKYIFVVFLLFLFHSINTQGAYEVIYKDNRPMKDVFNKSQKAQGETEQNNRYEYDPTGKTDPFKSFIAIQEETGDKPKPKPKTYLETLDLSQLELIAVIRGAKGDWAMVRESKGTGHVIKKGTAIGTNGGIVYKIYDGGIIIREEYRDFRGETKHKDIKKSLPALK